VDVPLASTFMLSTKVGKPKDAEAAKSGTKLARGANFKCLMSGTPISGDYIKAEGKVGRIGTRLMAIVAEGKRGQIYLAPTPKHEEAAHKAMPEWKPEVTISGSTQYLGVKPYGMERFDQLCSDRQLVALATFADLVVEARERIRHDAVAAGLSDAEEPLYEGGTGATAYAEAVAVFLGFTGSRMADRHSSLCRWDPNPSGYAPKIANTFGRQALPMVWDYVEGNPFSPSSGNLLDAVGWIVKVIETSLSAFAIGVALQSVRSVPPRRWPTTAWSRAGPSSPVWRRRRRRQRPCKPISCEGSEHEAQIKSRRNNLGALLRAAPHLPPFAVWLTAPRYGTPR
jgi:putative DNA methylase